TIEIADSGTEQADILSLIKDHWHDIGVGLFIKPTSLEVLRRRTFAGMTMMTLAKGVENGLASPKTSPAGFAPTSQIQYQWSGWGQYFETAGQSGVAPDMPQAIELLANYRKWAQATSTQAKSEAWRQILAINSDYLFTIGLLAGTSQPIVAAASLRNVPEEAIWNWDPGAHFGVYRPDLFWFDDEARRQGEAGRRP
ncbi:MAG: ABC transporter substrate-binding protein, partial [Pseudomonadota bacterium]